METIKYSDLEMYIKDNDKVVLYILPDEVFEKEQIEIQEMVYKYPNIKFVHISDRDRTDKEDLYGRTYYPYFRVYYKEKVQYSSSDFGGTDYTRLKDVLTRLNRDDYKGEEITGCIVC